MKKIEQKGKVSFGQAIGDFFKGYFDFRGRTTRAGYWWSQLMLILVMLVLYIWTFISIASSVNGEPNIAPIILLVLFILGIIIPLFTIQVRRLRDTGMQSKALLAYFIIYYALLYTWFMSFYTSSISNITNALAAYSNSSSSVTPSLGGAGTSSILLFFFSIFSIFSSVAMFLPTNYLATESKNPFLRFLFVEKEEEVTEVFFEDEIRNDAQNNTSVKTDGDQSNDDI